MRTIPFVTRVGVCAVALLLSPACTSSRTGTATHDRTIPVSSADLGILSRNPDGSPFHPPGAANIFLVRAATADVAAAAARQVFEQGYPSNGEAAASTPAWVVVYLGTGSSMSCRMESVEYSGSRRRVRLRYASLPEGIPVTADIRVCAALVPLGPLPDGVFTLELYDTRRRLVTLMRKWALRPWGAADAVFE